MSSFGILLVAKVGMLEGGFGLGFVDRLGLLDALVAGLLRFVVSWLFGCVFVCCIR